MTVATRLNTYLTNNEISYKVISHYHSNSSLSTSITANVPLKNIAKAVILEDHQNRKIMAVLPANKKISLSKLNDALYANFHLAKEQEIYYMFDDCDRGAIPPIADAYNMAMVCDTDLDKLDYVYIEAGDHETLIRLDKTSFNELTRNSKRLHFSHEIYH